MKYFIVSLLCLIALAMSSCSSPSPEELAAESKALHEQLSRATTEADSTAVFRQISALETHAREIFNKQELRQYERLAHDDK